MQKDLVAEIDGAVAQVRPLVPGGVVLCVEHAAAVPHVFADGVRLNQMLVQLLLNAMGHTASGSVTVHTSLQPAFGGEVRVQVADTGLGMTEREVEVRRFFLILSLSHRGRDFAGCLRWAASRSAEQPV